MCFMERFTLQSKLNLQNLQFANWSLCSQLQENIIHQKEHSKKTTLSKRWLWYLVHHFCVSVKVVRKKKIYLLHQAQNFLLQKPHQNFINYGYNRYMSSW